MITALVTISGLALFSAQIAFIEYHRWLADFHLALGTANAVFSAVRDYGITPEVKRGKVIFENVQSVPCRRENSNEEIECLIPQNLKRPQKAD